MAIETLSVNVDSIHDQVDATLQAVCGAAEKVRRIGLAVEERAGELFRHSPAEQLRQASAAARTLATGMLLNALEVAGKAERLELIAALYDADDAPPSTQRER